MADTGKTRVKRETDRGASYRIPDCADSSGCAGCFCKRMPTPRRVEAHRPWIQFSRTFSTGSSSPLRAVAHVFESLMAREHARFVTVVENKSLVSGVGVSSKTTDYSHKIIRLEACPPTSAPSISGCSARAAALSGLTLPPYTMRITSATADDASSPSSLRMRACTSCAAVVWPPCPCR